MNIFFNTSVGSKEISEVIDSLNNNPKEMVALARDYNLPMPTWSIWSLLT